MEGYVVMLMIASVLILISAVLFFLSTIMGKVKNTSKVKEKALEAVTECSEGEFRLKLAKHMKEMEGSQKELLDALKNQNTLLQAQIDKLQHELSMLSEKQVNQTKSIIKFNKENARQLAISERETLEYVMTELKKVIEDNAGGAEVKQITEVVPVVEEIPDIVEEIPDIPNDISDIVEEIPDIPEEDMDLSALFDELAEGAMEEALPAEPVPAPEEKAEEQAQDPMAGFGSDPNAMMTPEEIAKLLESMGQ